MSPRVVIAVENMAGAYPDEWLPTVDLPDAEHIHVTVDRATGKVTAVAMERAREGDDDQLLIEVFTGAISVNDAPVWRDVEGGAA